MKKVLIITYYWPPSGGAGVQRWLKLVKYLGHFNIKPYVLTVDEKYASYIQTDSSLCNEITKNVTVIKTRSFEPINLYAKLAGKKNVPTAGFSNVDNEKFTQKAVNFIRSNFFIPDPRKGWIPFAYRKALQIIKKENIDTVITTSPPHSTQLTGLKLKKKLNINWIADLRDPWTDIYYYKILGHSVISASIDKNYEKKVLLNCDRITTVSENFKTLFQNKGFYLPDDKFSIIPNGYDPGDFKIKRENSDNEFIICYAGTISEQYNPYIFLDEFNNIIKKFPQIAVKLRFVGIIFEKLKRYINEAGIENNVEIIPPVPHDEAVSYITNANALLLIIPEIKNSQGIIPGKLFEYLATLNKIICIGDPGGDAAKIIAKCEAGITFDRNSNYELRNYIMKLIHDYINGSEIKTDPVKIEDYSRKNQAGMFAEIIKQMNP
jgi:glycosyltransferase involved in cell wall biosynthesis